MDTIVNCPNCETPHTTVSDGHRNIVCSICNTEFSVLTKNRRVRSVSKVLRPRKTQKQERRPVQKTSPVFDFPFQKVFIGIIIFALAIFLFRWLRFGGIILILLAGGIYYRFFRKE